MGTRHFESIKEETLVNKDTGEVIDTVRYSKSIFKHSSGEPNFVKFYLQDLGKLKNLQQKAMLVLFELLAIMDYNNEISVSIGKKKDIAYRLDIWNVKKDGTKELGTNIVDQHITKLVKSGLLMRKDKGMYIANPKIFGRGKWEDIRKIKMHVEYTEDGKVIVSNVDKKAQ